MKTINIIFWWIFILSIPLLLISSTVVLELNFLPFYEYAYQKYHISEATGFTNDQLMVITRHLIQFFNDKVAHVQLMIENNGKPIYLFHDYEIEHLNDVKALFRYTFQILIVTLLYCLSYLLFTIVSRNRKKWYYFWKGLRKGNILTLGLLLSLGIAIYFGFHNLFTRFHYLVFGDPRNSPWMLDPRTDYLIRMYPLDFWQDAVILGTGLVILATLLLIFISSIVLISYRKRIRN